MKDKDLPDNLHIKELTGNVAIGENIKQEVQVNIDPVINIETIREITKSECQKIKEISYHKEEIIKLDNKKTYFFYTSIFTLSLFALSSYTTNKFINEIQSYLLIVFIVLFLYAIIIGKSAEKRFINLVNRHETDLRVAKELLKEYTKYLPKKEAENARICIKIAEELLAAKSKLIGGLK